MSHLGHFRPMHSVPVPINVRRYSNSDMIVRRSEVTLRVIFDIYAMSAAGPLLLRSLPNCRVAKPT